jgi:uncharacterized protein with ParB-like and HNH nuclease domain
MSYKSDTIATIIPRLNAQYFLPAIQREFIWPPAKVVQLIDSILRGYPIGSFLFWELKPESRERWEAYEFIQQASERNRHNQVASTAGVKQLTLILDGQQRLTSLLVAFKGKYEVKIKYRRWNDPKAWDKQTLYLDLLRNPGGPEEDGELGLHYGLEFKEGTPNNDHNHHWFKLSRILDFDSEDAFDEFRLTLEEDLPDQVTKGQLVTFRKNLDRLYRAVWKNDVVSYYTEQDQDYDRVLDIFVRANQGGTILSKSDLLLSMVAAKWEGMNARDAIYDFVDSINNDLTRKNNFDKDFIMKNCLVLSDLPVQYRVQNFNNQNLELMRTRWEAIKSAVSGAVDLVNCFGVDRDNLTSANALIPIIYYLCQHPSVRVRAVSTRRDVQNVSSIRRWLVASLLNNVFGGNSDGVLEAARKALQQTRSQEDFPINELIEALAKLGRNCAFDKYAIDDFLNLRYGRQLTFLGLSLLYDDKDWGTKTFHQDHVFPRSLFSKQEMSIRGIDSEQQFRYQMLADRVGNLELLSLEENEEKSNQDFERWLQTRDRSFRRKHLIPHDDRLLRLERFEDFVKAREKLIEERLQALFGAVQA